MNKDALLEEVRRRPVLSVSELTAQIKDLLETAFPAVWVSGEISNFSRPRSGHCYLTLKDEDAQIPAVIWRNTAAQLRFDLHDGLEVVCRGLRGRLPSSRQLPTDHPADRAQGHRGAGIGAAAASRQARPRRVSSIRHGNGPCRDSCGGSPWSPAPPARPSAISSRCFAAAGPGPTCLSCRCECRAKAPPRRSPRPSSKSID